MGIRNWIGRGRRPATAASYPVAAAAYVERKPLTPEQLADLDAARAELLQLAAQVGVKSLNACPRDGSRWQDDPTTIRTITALIRETHHKEETWPEDDGPPR